MNARERLAATLNHREPDRVPVDLGGIASTITTTANEALKAHLGLVSDDRLMDRVLQVVVPGEPLLERFQVDTRYVHASGPQGWRDIELPGDEYEDAFGIRRKAAFGPGDKLLYYDFVGHPLQHIETAAELARFDWPDPHDPTRYAGMEAAARDLYEQTEYAVIANVCTSIFEFAWYLRGFMPFFQDLLVNRPLADALLDAVLDYQMALIGETLARVGRYVQVVMTASDLGGQSGPLISEDLYRSVVWPRDKKLWDFIRSRTDAKIWYHTDGGVYPLIPCLIEGGVEALHPVQPGAAEMDDRRRLKREFGDRLTFWGGFDQQHVLSFGTPEQVREEARRLLDDFMPGGGFVFAAGHNIQHEVPADNIVALFDTVLEYGHYRREGETSKTHIS